MIEERRAFLISVARRLNALDSDLGFIEDAAATLDLPYEFGVARRQLSEFRVWVKEQLQDA
jgi:hypothetical protein